MKTFLLILICVIFCSCAQKKPSISAKIEGVELREMDFQGALQFVDSLHQIEKQKLWHIIDSLLDITEKNKDVITKLEQEVDILIKKNEKSR